VQINEAKMNEFVGKMLGDMGAAVSGSLVVIGDKLGLYKTLATDGPLNSEQLSEKTKTNERYIREWLSAQAASGYIEYDSESQKFSMSPEQIAVFADDNSPMLMTGGFYSLSAAYVDEPKVTEAFKTGNGVSWGDHSSCLFCGTAKFFRSSYQAHLIQEWIPSLTKVDEKLAQGAKAADVGCGYGISTVLMAKHYPKSQFFGFDIHEHSISEARKLAKKEGVGNVTFEVSAAKTFEGTDYDLVACFDCLHDMGDPAGASAHIYRSLNEDGSWMIVEPFAYDKLEENINPIGRLYYSFSTQICTPASLSQEVGAALGAQAGEKRLREVIEPAGFGTIRRATETPFNIILEARK
jgi:ubiquinone/menaquinone biosynthesis C-methylase UbiE